jgi:hypothetical protein
MKNTFKNWLPVMFIIMLVYSCDVFAFSYSSPSFVMKKARIVVSGGKATSYLYSLDNVRIGENFGGKAQSANYTLDATDVKETTASLPPNPPTLDPVITPTNVSPQALSGSKDSDTSIYINGYSKVLQDGAITWNCDWTLSEGDNYLLLTARNSYGLESDVVYATITLDTVLPAIVITNPPADTLVHIDQINVEGTVDGASFIEQKQLNLGINLVLINKTDQAGNASNQSVEIYRARQPINLPVR